MEIDKKTIKNLLIELLEELIKENNQIRGRGNKVSEQHKKEVKRQQNLRYYEKKKEQIKAKNRIKAKEYYHKKKKLKENKI